MATFDFDWEGICAGQQSAVQDMLDQIQAAVEEWSARLAGYIQLNQSYEPTYANFVTAWLNEAEGNTLPIPDKVKFTWIKPGTPYVASEYMAINGEVTRLENEYYSGKAFHYESFQTDNGGNWTGLNTGSGPLVLGLSAPNIVRKAQVFARRMWMVGVPTGGATGGLTQVNAQLGTTNPAVPVGIIAAHPVPTTGSRLVYSLYLPWYAGEVVTPGNYFVSSRVYAALAAGLSGADATYMLPNAPATFTTKINAYRLDGEVIYGNDL
jgi:hypothetical protein